MDGKERLRRSVGRRVSSAAVLASIFLCTMLGLAGLGYWSQWRDEVAKTTELATVLSTAAAEQIGGSLRSIDLLMQHVGQYALANGELDAPAIFTSLDIHSRRFPEMAELIIADAAGRVHASGAGNGRDVSQRDYFVLQKLMYRDNQVVIDGPLRDAATGEWRIVLSRPLVGRNGQFRGVVAAELKPSFFADPLQSTGMRDHGDVMLINVNRVVFGRFPDGDRWIGTTLPDTASLPAGADGAVRGTMRTAGLIDGVDELIAYREVRNYPLVVVAGIPVDLVKQGWWSGVSWGFVILAFIGLVMVTLAVLFDRKDEQRRRAALDLARLNEELESRVVERTRSLKNEILDRRRAEAETEKMKEAYQELFGGAIEGILIHRDFKPLLANQSFARLFGFESVDDVLALPSIVELIAPGTRARVAGATDEAIRSGRPSTIEFEGVCREGGVLWCLNSIRPVRWGNEPAVQAAFVNVTASKTWQAQLSAAKDAAERASALKSRFLAVASHDLRQPVQALAFYVNALGKRISGAEPEEILRRAADSTASLSGLLDSLLDLSRLDAGVVRPDLQPVALRAMLERLWALYCPSAEQAGISLSVVPSNAHVLSDPILLERVLQNLIGNALRYTAAGGKVLVGCRGRGGSMAIQVIDTGCGIPEDMQGRIFEEFFRLGDSAGGGEPAGGGLGLGLSIVHRLCRLMAHQLSVHSQVGRGSMFEVRLRRAEPEAPADTASDGASAEAGPIAGARVMIVDADYRLRQSLELLLHDWGLGVLSAASAAEAGQLLQQGAAPDLILADYGTTGAAVIAAASAGAGRRPAAILLTAEAASASAEAADAGCRVLQKPVRPEILKAALGEALRGRQAEAPSSSPDSRAAATA